MKVRLAISIASMLVSSSALAQQFLPVKSIVNARDLGGYTVKDGRVVRDGMLIRAAHLADASDKDIAYLAGIPVSKVVDFRRIEEKRGKEDLNVPGADNIVLPIDASGKAADQASKEEMKKVKRGKKFDVKKIIVYMAFNDKAKAVAREMYPTLFSTLTARLSSPSSSVTSSPPKAAPSSITALRERTVRGLHRPYFWRR